MFIQASNNSGHAKIEFLSLRGWRVTPSLWSASPDEDPSAWSVPRLYGDLGSSHWQPQLPQRDIRKSDAVLLPKTIMFEVP